MKKISAFLTSLLMVCAVGLVSSCTTTEDEELIDEVTIEQFKKDIVGRWLMDGTQEYWRFDAQGNGSVAYGENWDVAEDVHEGEGNEFQWSIDSNGLMVIYKIGNDYNDPEPDAPYTIKSITASKMVWVTSGGEQQTLVRQ